VGLVLERAGGPMLRLVTLFGVGGLLPLDGLLETQRCFSPGRLPPSNPMSTGEAGNPP